MAKEKDLERAKTQAKCQLESIKEMVKRLEHAQNCTDDECTEGKDGGDTWDDAEGYHNEEKAQQTIYEDALSVEVRSGWHLPGESSSPTEYTILLCTGGPAVRIIGYLDRLGQPDSAELEYQDWFTEWTPCPTEDEDDAALLTYAQQFYFGS